MKERKRYRVIENSIHIVLETNCKLEAENCWREAHRQNDTKFHEVYELIDGHYEGICQFAPGDKVR